ncbi:CMRF35-like molecule 3 isoform X2 [Boleophthalmus pectinirostris]|uniref:CMRF35-like molecule 3 isoform X2 n=1 Tax=Boleophthalmus pectinirostris TaxID=150288 RepID=UPI002432D897|nr:CMRF35-like molecule 3 isoform X2 [Boleophthalmus pectinirostris]
MRNLLNIKLYHRLMLWGTPRPDTSHIKITFVSSTGREQAQSRLNSLHAFILLDHICDVADKMKIFSIIAAAYCFLLAVNGTSISAKGSEGGTVSFRSFHKFAQDNLKYFCIDPCTSEKHVLAKVTPRRSIVSDRITLLDHGDGSFTVTLSNLRRSDSGKYWCGVDRFVDTFTPVYLQVTEGMSYNATTSIETTAITEVASTFGFIINSTEETFQANCSHKTEETTTTRTLQQEKEKLSRFVLYLIMGAVAVLTVTIIGALCFRKLRPQVKVCSVFMHPISSDLNQVHNDNRTDAGNTKHEPANQPIYENINPSKPMRNTTISRHDHFPSYVQPLPALPEKDSVQICGANTETCATSKQSSLWFGLISPET